MNPENGASAGTQHAGLTPENAELTGRYTGLPRALAADRAQPAHLPRSGPVYLT